MSDKEDFERRVGTTIRGKWTLERLLGFGGMAAVYVGAHKIGRREAIKILHPEIARMQDLRARFEQEAQAVNRFRHPGAVEIRDIDTTEDGAPFLVMELLEGESLSDRARRLGGLPLDELLRVTDELLDVLVAAHAQGIIHRDIKLDNLFLQSDGRLKVLDFGIARMRDGAMKTRTGATLGTVAYMPPEQVKGLEIDARADLFAVGATMFRVIAKRRLHDAVSESDMLVKMATTPARPLASVVPDVPPHVALVVDRALAFERERRYPDARTMQEDVRALRNGAAPPFASARAAVGDLPNPLPGAPVNGPSMAGPIADGPTVAPAVAAAAVSPAFREAPTVTGPVAAAPAPGFRDAPTATPAAVAAYAPGAIAPAPFAGAAPVPPTFRDAPTVTGPVAAPAAGPAFRDAATMTASAGPPPAASAAMLGGPPGSVAAPPSSAAPGWGAPPPSSSPGAHLAMGAQGPVSMGAPSFASGAFATTEPSPASLAAGAPPASVRAYEPPASMVVSAISVAQPSTRAQPTSRQGILLVAIAGVVTLIGIGIGLAWASHRSSDGAESASAPATSSSSEGAEPAATDGSGSDAPPSANGHASAGAAQPNVASADTATPAVVPPGASPPSPVSPGQASPPSPGSPPAAAPPSPASPPSQPASRPAAVAPVPAAPPPPPPHEPPGHGHGKDKDKERGKKH